MHNNVPLQQTTTLLCYVGGHSRLQYKWSFNTFRRTNALLNRSKIQLVKLIESSRTQTRSKFIEIDEGRVSTYEWILLPTVVFFRIILLINLSRTRTVGSTRLTVAYHTSVDTEGVKDTPLLDFFDILPLGVICKSEVSRVGIGISRQNAFPSILAEIRWKLSQRLTSS